MKKTKVQPHGRKLTTSGLSKYLLMQAKIRRLLKRKPL